MEYPDLFEFDDEEAGVGFTIVPNAFITYYMPKAKANYVKVYLAGLRRCYGSRSEQWASYQTLSDELQLSVDVVKRAWRYWESVGLIRRVPRYLRDLSDPFDYRTEPDTEYCHRASNIIRFKRNIQPPSEQGFSTGQNSPLPPGKTAPSPRAELPPKEIQEEETQIEERQDKTNVPSRRVLSSWEVYLERPPSPTECRILARLEREYGTEWVEASLQEYLVQSDKQEISAPIRYIEGVLRNWRVEGMRLTDILAHLRRMKGERG